MNVIDYVSSKFEDDGSGELSQTATPIEGLLWELLGEAKKLRAEVERLKNPWGGHDRECLSGSCHCDKATPVFPQEVLDSFAGVGEIDKSYEEVWGRDQMKG